jgi:DNA repair exonuclease SbcCD ATPase subunit
MATAQTVPEWRATADEIWAILREVTRKHEEIAQMQKEAERAMAEYRKEIERIADEQRKEAERTAEQRKEAERIAAEQRKEAERAADEQRKEAERAADEHRKEIEKQIKATDRQMKETDKRVGEMANRFGEVVEYMIVPNLVAKFRELKFTFTKAGIHVKIEDDENEIFAEVDAFLENGDKVMIVEIKTTPRSEDIKRHIERMDKLRRYANMRNDQRVYLGAIAGVVFSKELKAEVLRNGFYVVEPSGDTFAITEPTGRFHVRKW